MRKGFSFIELIVVIGIIAMLSGVIVMSFGQARASARDGARISDLKQVQQALQLFYLKCGMYPGGYNPGQPTSPCVGGMNSASPATNNPDTWEELAETLKNANVGSGDIPNDPSPGKDYAYWIQLQGGNATPRAQCYVLRAQLETNHRALTQDVDDADIAEKLLPSSGFGFQTLASKLLYPFATEYCDDDDKNYCIGNTECFYDR
ncbi:MAG: prepilin-type N-terminal cleavage/methylation domain-containing protein [Patescibacteria group bacterium]